MKRKTMIKKTLVALGTSLMLSISAHGQTAEATFKEALTHMKAGKWEEALNAWSGFISKGDVKAQLNQYGPKFGVFYYNKGICHDRLGQFDQAMQAYKICNENFKNKSKKKENAFEGYALYKKAESAMRIPGSPNYKEAITGYEGFILLHNKGERFPTKPSEIRFDNVYCNLAIAYFLTGDLERGLKAFDTALDKREEFKITTNLLFKTFEALTEAAIKGGKDREVIKFLNKHRGKLLTDPYSDGVYAGRLLEKANSAKDSYPVIAAQLMSLIGESETTIDFLESDEKQLSSAPFKTPFRDGTRFIATSGIKPLIGELQKVSGGGKPFEMFTMTQNAYLWLKQRNSSAAYGVFKELERNYSRAENREDNLFQLISTANAIGFTSEANHYGRRFLEAFPDSDKAQRVKRLMLIGLYIEKEYEECLKVAKELLPELEPGEKEHDMCLHVLGGSYFYTNEFAQARRALEEHKSQYFDSSFREEGDYLHGTVLARLSRFEESATALDAFIKKYKNEGSSLYPFALFERANVAYSLRDDEGALSTVATIEKSFAKSNIIPPTLNLKGNIFEEKGDLETAEANFKKAFEKGKEKGDDRVASESLYFLINLISDNELEDRYTEAIEYYDEFWRDYGKTSGYKAEVAVKGHSPMKAKGREKESFKKMETIITLIAKEKGGNLEGLITEYRDYYLEAHSLAELKAHFLDFPGIGKQQPEALAKLYISVINATESAKEEALQKKDEAKASKLQAETTVLFRELKRAFKPADLSPKALMQVGDFIRKNTATPIEGVIYYEEIIKRDNLANLDDAKFGIADIYARSANPSNHNKARAVFAEIMKKKLAGDKPTASENKQRERAHFGLVKLERNSRNWDDLITASTNYIKAQYPNGQNNSSANFYFAEASDKKGNEDTAYSAYFKAHFSNRAYVIIAAPSMKRMMEIQWKKNTPEKVDTENGIVKPGSRQEAYNIGWKYVEATRRHFEKMSEQEIRLWKEVEALVQQYEDTKLVEDMATQLKKQGIEN